MTNTNNQPSGKSKPVFRKQLPGGIGSAVFENSYEGRTYRSVNIQRSYRKDNKWTRMSIYLDHEQIPFMIEALQSAWQFLNDYPLARSNADEDASQEEPLDDSVDTAG